MDHLERQGWRLALLQTLYDRSNADTRQILDGKALAAAAGVPDEQTRPVASYLEEAGLVRCTWAMGGPPDFQITVRGIQEIEDALAAPDQPTRHLPAINIIHATHISGPIQQGGQGNVQRTTLPATDEISAAVRELRQALDSIDDPAAHARAEVHVQLLEAQAHEGALDHGTLKWALDALAQIGYGMAGSAGFQFLQGLLG
ncbi:hypothetical protein [Euzebya pacifica]|uniref:hypothetical protein n=1 Tax=Euzebya pacifica TaxID=1608957 RepID=UPI0013DECFD2|nr:hypothetical protein [Euzebya pacifica]